MDINALRATLDVVSTYDTSLDSIVESDFHPHNLGETHAWQQRSGPNPRRIDSIRGHRDSPERPRTRVSTSTRAPDRALNPPKGDLK